MMESLQPGEETLTAMREKFGDEQSEEYLRLVKALRALVHAWGAFCEAEENSLDEDFAHAQVAKMFDDMRAHPDHHQAITEGLLTITVSVIQGNTVEAWFGQVGVDFWNSTEETGQ